MPVSGSEKMQISQCGSLRSQEIHKEWGSRV